MAVLKAFDCIEVVDEDAQYVGSPTFSGLRYMKVTNHIYILKGEEPGNWAEVTKCRLTRGWFLVLFHEVALGLTKTLGVGGPRGQTTKVVGVDRSGEPVFPEDVSYTYNCS